MGKILFSIIIPSYNSALFIRRCLDSLLKQTYSNWEAIVIDNHSTDDTVSIVKSYGDSRIQCYLIHNEGVIAKSRNYGITFAKGDYVGKKINSIRVFFIAILMKKFLFITSLNYIERSRGGFTLINLNIENSQTATEYVTYFVMEIR